MSLRTGNWRLYEKIASIWFYFVDNIFDVFLSLSLSFHYRFRIPWKGGARKVRLDLVLPWIIVPFNLLFCSINLACLLFVHGILMPLTIYITYRFCLRSVRPQTKFFPWWSIKKTLNLNNTQALFYYHFEKNMKFQ